MPRITPRARVAQALVCPYCRDGVGAEAVACACGALYHAACFDECVREHGGCAILGCRSRERQVLSAPRRHVRVFRLYLALLALALAPRGVARNVRATRGHGVFRALGDAFVTGLRAFGWYLEQFPSRGREPSRQSPWALPVILVQLGVALWVASRFSTNPRDQTFFLVLVASGFLPPLLLGFLASLGVSALHGLARAFATELDSLERGGERTHE